MITIIKITKHKKERAILGNFLNRFIELIQSYGISGLIALSFAESSFFPIPPDILLIPMCLVNRKLSILYALLTTAASVLGGMFGHILGKKFGKPLLRKLFKESSINKVRNYFDRYGGWAIAVAGFTPIPYKIFTISAGAFNVRMSTLVLASIIGRGARFFLEGILIFLFGDTAKYLIENYFEAITMSITVLLIIFYYVWKKLKSKKRVKNTGIVVFLKNKYNKFYNFLTKNIGYDKSMMYFFIGICLSLISLFIFFELVEYSLNIGSLKMDINAVNYFLSIRSDLLTSLFKTITSTGNFLFILILSLVVIAILLYKRKSKEALFLGISNLGIWLFNEALKQIFKRPRPLGIHLVKVHGYSFPSGHAMIFMGFSLFLIYLILKNLKNKLISYILSTSIFIYSILVGISRVYLGVHYLSDVFAGWIAAVLWVFTWIIIYRIVILNCNKRGQSIR